MPQTQKKVTTKMKLIFSGPSQLGKILLFCFSSVPVIKITKKRAEEKKISFIGFAFFSLSNCLAGAREPLGKTRTLFPLPEIQANLWVVQTTLLQYCQHLAKEQSALVWCGQGLQSEP